MAPEQVEGKTSEIDARTDIFARGAVVYEMATGKKAFDGKTSASVMAKILEVDPPSMVSLQPMTPPSLDHIVKTCLEKDPELRWQAASDLCRELKWMAEGGSQVMLAPAAAMRGIRALGRQSLIFGLGTPLLGLAIASLVTWNLKSSPPRPVTRTVITLPPGQQLASLNDGPAVALSPDGTHLAYVAQEGGVQQLYLRAMDSLQANPIPGTQGAISPFLSPDRQWLGFFAGGQLKKVSVSGGTALTLGNAEFSYGASWGSQGRIAFAPTLGSALQQMSDAGGTPRMGNSWPSFKPVLRRYWISGYCGSTTARRSRSSERPSSKGDHGFPLTGTGSRMFRTNRAVKRFTCNPIRVPAGSCQSRRKAAMSQCGIPTERSCFTEAAKAAKERMMAVDIATQPSFSAGKPRLLFKGQYAPTRTTPANYDVSPDGQRFLMLKSDEQSSSSAATQIVVVQNWFEELKQKVPAGKK